MLQNFMKEAEDYGDYDGPFYLISLTWFQKYLKYLQDIEDQGDNYNLYMDCIDQSDILLKDIILLDEEDEQANYIIKPGLKEKNDYIMISEKFWMFLYKKYNGIPIKRYTIHKASSKYVEVYLKKVSPFFLKLLFQITLTLIPNMIPIKDSIMDIYINHGKTILDMVGKIMNIYEKFEIGLKEIFQTNGRMLIIKTSMEEYQRIIKNLNSNGRFNSVQTVQGVLLNGKCKIEDAQISEDDIVIFCLISKNGYDINVQKKRKRTQKFNRAGSITLDQNINNIKNVLTSQGLDEREVRQQYGNKLQQIEKYFDLQLEIGFNKYSRLGKTGLNNLGNTCFMNSGIQCIGNIQELTDHFLSNKFVKDLNFDNTLGTSKSRVFQLVHEITQQVIFGKENKNLLLHEK